MNASDCLKPLTTAVDLQIMVRYFSDINLNFSNRLNEYPKNPIIIYIFFFNFYININIYLESSFNCFKNILAASFQSQQL